MAEDENVLEIRVCLGSSCFARGNAEHLALLEKYVESRGLGGTLRLTGRLCQDECKQGPNLQVGGETHHDVTAARLRELVQRLGKPTGSSHGTA